MVNTYNSSCGNIQDNFSKGFQTSQFKLDAISPSEFQNDLVISNEKINAFAMQLLSNTLKDSQGSSPFCIATTGSDGRKEKMGAKSPVELILIFRKKEDADCSEVIRKVEDLVKSHTHLFDPDLEIKYLDSDQMMMFDHPKTGARPFPTRALDATYIGGELEIFNAYKHQFFNELKDPKATKMLSSFKHANLKKSLKLLRDGMAKTTEHMDMEKGKLFYDGKLIKASKYPLLRSVQYMTALKICETIYRKKLNDQDLREMPSSVIERLAWLKTKNLVSVGHEEIESLSKAYALSLIWLKQAEEKFEASQQKEIDVDPQELKNVADIILGFSQAKQVSA